MSEEEKETSHPIHRILLVKTTSATDNIQILVQTSESMNKCKEVFDELVEKHDIKKKDR